MYRRYDVRGLDSSDMNMKKILIGGGGHARSIAEAVGAEKFDGYTALEEAKVPFGVPYAGRDSDILGETCAVHIAVGFNNGIRMTLRRKIIDFFDGVPVFSVISPHAVVTSNSVIGDGSAVMINAVVNRSVLGRHCVVNTGAIVEHDCRIGENVFIAPGAVLCGEVTVGDDVFIGAGSVIRNGVSICSGASVGMGAVVASDLSVPGMYVGYPARLLESYQ